MNMKLSVLTGIMFAATSFAALAATPVDRQQSEGLQAMGSVSVTGVSGSLDDATDQLQQKAEEMGATHYRVIRTDTPGDSSLWSGNAEIYR
ncbi:DUF1471 domain-containing protein [Pantoea sp. FN060301]|uniref:DUF1471 domain-containing protein n=1 Tax=Pantoea sp. FN060301 TaxID=3420380 RepID=UPI003D17F452